LATTSTINFSGWTALREKFAKQGALETSLAMLAGFRKTELHDMLGLNLMELVVIHMQLRQARKTIGFKVKS
jgi:hypothetical protein